MVPIEQKPRKWNVDEIFQLHMGGGDIERLSRQLVVDEIDSSEPVGSWAIGFVREDPKSNPDSAVWK